MRTKLRSATLIIALGAFALSLTPALADPLPSWNEGPAKNEIIAFVDGVTDHAGPDYVTPKDRIAVFDNDGTLWAEQPVYLQVFFAMDRIAEMAKTDPSILTSDSLKAAASGDLAGALAGGEEGLLELISVSHSELSVEDFQAEVANWLATARHPEKDVAYDTMIYQPMLELLSYLRDNDFDTYIVSGGGLHFMRTFAEEAYGIPPEQVIGSTGNTSYDVKDGVPTITKDAGIYFIDDKQGKPVEIDRRIGKRPIFVGGNSDGDFQMLEWATAGDGPRFGLIVHHTDADREWAYDRESHVGQLVRGLDEGPDRGWLIVDMAGDWKKVFPWQE